MADAGLEAEALRDCDGAAEPVALVEALAEREAVRVVEADRKKQGVLEADAPGEGVASQPQGGSHQVAATLPVAGSTHTAEGLPGRGPVMPVQRLLVHTAAASPAVSAPRSWPSTHRKPDGADCSCDATPRAQRKYCRPQEGAQTMPSVWLAQTPEPATVTVADVSAESPRPSAAEYARMRCEPGTARVRVTEAGAPMAAATLLNRAVADVRGSLPSEVT